MIPDFFNQTPDAYSFHQQTLTFLRHCYRFVEKDWQHAAREMLPDQGFEIRFREECIINLPDWSISQERELHLGEGLDTASGVPHEIDLVARHAELTAILEMKNRQGHAPDKNDVIVFFAKILDYLASNPSVLHKEVCPIIISSTNFDENGLAACLGLGVHPIAPGLRPVPILLQYRQIVDNELKSGIIIPPYVDEQIADFSAILNRLVLNLNQTWLSSRCGYQSENSILLRAVGGIPTLELAHHLRNVNALYAQIKDQIISAKTRAKL